MTRGDERYAVLPKRMPLDKFYDELFKTQDVLNWKHLGWDALSGTFALSCKLLALHYPKQPKGLTSLDLEVVCYCWINGISDVAIVAFVRKRDPEI